VLLPCFLCACPASSDDRDAASGTDLSVDRATADLVASDSDGAPPKADWVVRLDRSKAAAAIPPSILGHYDLSGALFGYDKVSGLAAKMKQAGFSEWRVGLGRWEIATQLLPSLTDGAPCVLTGFPPESFAPTGSTDLTLMAARDWFTYTDGTPVTKAMTADDSRYALSYIREVIDVAKSFDAAPFVSIDLMPRALSAGKSPKRVTGGPLAKPCEASFSNAVSNAVAADPAVFAAAVAGMVKRVVEGSGGEKARDVVHWEVWNEPELPQFWDKRFEPKGNLDAFFKMAILTLVELDAYRAASGLAQVKKLRFGLASFAHATSAAAIIKAFDDTPLAGGAKVPLDFISFHSYDNDPLKIVGDIEQVAAARDKTKSYKKVGLVLAEWGPVLDGTGWDPATMDLPLLVSTVLALGTPAGLERAHHAIFWDFYQVIRFGLLDHDVKPKPLYHAYALLAPVVGSGNKRLPPVDAPSGRLDGGKGAVLASEAAGGETRALLTNRDASSRTVRFEVDGKPVTPAKVTLFDDPKQPPRDAAPAAVLTLPARSLMLVEL
jgi:hypothetical protein